MQPSLTDRLRAEWLRQPHVELLSGLLVALALIPEAIAFSIIAGVDPKVGLYASVCIAVVTAFAGGRPAMISAATGAMALLMITLVKQHGLDYLFAATLLTGALQVAFGFLKLARFMNFVPRPVMVGFVNALAILIFSAQFPQFEGATWVMYALVAASLAIIYGLPYLTKAVPSALVAIVAVTAFVLATGLHTRTVGDMGALPSSLPFFHWPAVPFTWATLAIVLPYSVGLALVGLVESLLTANLLDEVTDTPSDKHREAKAQGLANLITGCFGGMAGCAMIGQSMINVGAGARGRLSTLSAGLFLLLLMLALGPWVARIPMAALVAVMFMVAIGTFDWSSLRGWRTKLNGELAVMVLTVGSVVLTHNLAIGVVLGVVVSSLLFAHQVVHLAQVRQAPDSSDETRRYQVHGELFFASVEGFLEGIQLHEHPPVVVLDFTHAHVWDGSAIAAIEKVVGKLQAGGSRVELVGLNEASAALHQRLARPERPGVALAAGH